MPTVDLEIMELAIEVAKKSISESDNRVHPKVGVVIVKKGKVLETGCRGELCAGEHAEYTVLERKLKEKDLAGAILYTTLEPCTTRQHPKIPCVKWIVKRRIHTVVIGILDPNPEIRGKGVLFLRENNVLVEHFPAELQLKVEEINKDFIEQIKKKPSIDDQSLIDASPSYEKRPIYAASIDDLSLESIKFYLDRINLKIEVPSEELWQFFVKKEFLIIEGEKRILIPTAAGLFLFGKDPETFLVQSKIKADCFRGIEPVETIDYLDIKGTLPKIIDETTRFFLRNMKSAMRIEGFSRVEITEYPTEALREAVRNAIIHRDYAIEGATVMVKMFRDRLVVESPGLLPRPLTLEKIRSLNYKPISRNPIIARAMFDMGFIEERGGGIKRMHDLMLNHGLEKPDFNYDSGYFTVTFYGPGEKIIDIHPKEITVVYAIEPAKLPLLNDRQKGILKYLLEHGRIASEECTKHFSITRDTANRDFKKLIKEGLIEKRGRGRATYYVLKDKER
jgi:ATP-dependent DNA helicase RecG